MKNFKHTPGPWKFKAITPNEKYGQSYDIEIDSGEYKWLAYTVANKVATISEEEAEANARLIAAAPEMLQALREFFEASNSNLVRDNTPIAYRKFRELATKAIAKATNQKEVSNG